MRFQSTSRGASRHPVLGTVAISECQGNRWRSQSTLVCRPVRVCKDGLKGGRLYLGLKLAHSTDHAAELAVAEAALLHDAALLPKLLVESVH